MEDTKDHGASGPGKDEPAAPRSDFTNYVLRLDKSPAGRETLAKLRVRDDDIADRFKSVAARRAIEMWEAGLFEYILLWGTFSWVGGLTMPVANAAALLDDALPIAMGRNQEKGGPCIFLLALADDVEQRFRQRVSDLAESTGIAIRVFSPDAASESPRTLH